MGVAFELHAGMGMCAWRSIKRERARYHSKCMMLLILVVSDPTEELATPKTLILGII